MGRAALLCATIALAAGLSACGRTASSSETSSAGIAEVSSSTPPAKKPASKAVWALYREVNSLDPAKAFDYPENTVVSEMCEALERQEPNGEIKPGLATVVYSSPTLLTVTIRPGAHFWDGSAVTAQDVAFSLGRNMNPATASLYEDVFSLVASISTDGERTVLIRLKRPDYWLAGELSAMPGMVLEKRYVQAKGSSFGTPGGGTMCSGPYKLAHWASGSGVTVVANADYWQATGKPLTHEIEFKGISEAGALTSGIETGEVDGTYLNEPATLGALRHLQNVHVYDGPSFDTDYFIVASTKGVLGDVRVRRALSLAFDRHSYIDSVYNGSAIPLRLSVNPGTWGFARSVFERAWNEAPEPKRDIAQARKLIAEAHAAGKPLTIATATESTSTATEADAWQAVADELGLKARLVNFSAQNYINLFTEPSARAGVDAFTTTTYGDYADPAALDSTYAMPGGIQNFDNFSNPEITRSLEAARGEANPTKRAEDDVAAEKLIMKELPWIPVAGPETYLVLNRSLTGPPSAFSYMQAPALAQLGAP